MNIIPGNRVPISLQLFDGRDDRDVRARVLTPGGTELADLKMVHLQGGLYRAEDEYRMPEGLEYITVQYRVLNSDDYALATETFVQGTDVEEITRGLLDEKDNKHDNYYQGTITLIECDDFMEGVIDGIVEAKAS